jgi:formylglycine-generating enzyme required for sulfatase activity
VDGLPNTVKDAAGIAEKLKELGYNVELLFDMHGNVWEWCWDYSSIPTSAPATDPAGPDSGTHRINRGGSWASNAKFLRSAARPGDFPETAGSNMGFRLAKNIKR